MSSRKIIPKRLSVQLSWCTNRPAIATNGSRHQPRAQKNPMIVTCRVMSIMYAYRFGLSKKDAILFHHHHFS